jgi:hypothetical protein
VRARRSERFDNYETRSIWPMAMMQEKIGHAEIAAMMVNIVNSTA